MATMAREQNLDTRATVEQIAVPGSARTLSQLSRIDYEDAFRISGLPAHERTGERRTGEQWARAVMEDASPAVKAKLLAGWSALGLRLGPPQAKQRVLGWKVCGGDANYVLLGAGGSLGLSGELLFKSEPNGLLFATFVRKDNPLARLMWARVETKHQEVVHSLLVHAARRAAR